MPPRKKRKEEEYPTVSESVERSPEALVAARNTGATWETSGTELRAGVEAHVFPLGKSTVMSNLDLAQIHHFASSPNHVLAILLLEGLTALDERR